MNQGKTTELKKIFAAHFAFKLSKLDSHWCPIF